MDSRAFRLDGRTVVITGSAGLLGRQHAEAIASAGGMPILLDLDQDPLDALAADLNERHGAGARGFAVDITEEAAIAQTCVEVREMFGKVDGLVNNAANNPAADSIGAGSRLESFALGDWNDDLAVGLTGAFLCAKYFGQAIFETSDVGSIVNISSDLGLISPDQRLYSRPDTLDAQQPVKPVTYSVVKAGMIGLTRYLATYWARDGRVVVRCNAICPGGVSNGQEEDFVREVESRIPMGRMAEADELRGVLLLLLSSAASYMNGSVVVVDGGRTAW